MADHSWIYFLHPPRPNFAETMTEEEGAIFEAPDEDAARVIMESDPAIARGVVTGELRELRISLLRGRD
jgi:hypothetical protein